MTGLCSAYKGLSEDHLSVLSPSASSTPLLAAGLVGVNFSSHNVPQAGGR